MPRRRRNAATSRATASTAKTGKRGRGPDFGAVQLQKLVSRTVSDLVAAINQHMRGDMAAEVRAFIASKGSAGRAGKRDVPPRRLLPCIAPACSNPSKGPASTTSARSI